MMGSTFGDRRDIRFRLNGEDVAITVAPRTLLSDALRHLLGATGTHVGCEHGVCGACTVQIDGMAARACLTLAVQVAGSAVRTVEGLAPDPARLSVLQAAFRKHHALHCGFCTPGLLVSLDAFFAENPAPTPEQIRDVVSGHLCRCTGYAPILAAAAEAAATLRQIAEHADV